MEAVHLERFRLNGPLGIGANYEVYAATDLDTGRDVVLKRPWQQIIRNGQSWHVDQQSEQVIALHQTLGGAVPNISALVGYTERTRHDGYFGDGLPQEYAVLVEERAPGIPLVADIKDKFRGIPIGLGQNLFALYPLGEGTFDLGASVFGQLLEVEAAFVRSQRLLMDLRPQNVFFDPRQGKITVIDIGMSVDLTPTASARVATDIHDCLAELCKFYLAPQSPPTQVRRYGEPFGMGPPLGFAKELERMLQACRDVPKGPLQDITVAILQRLQRREYGAVAPFREDLQQYFALVEARNRHLQELADLVQAWRQGVELLREQYWRKFSFDPDRDLARYV